MERPVEAVTKSIKDRSDEGPRIRAYLKSIGINDDKIAAQLAEQILRLHGQHKNNVMEELFRSKDQWFLALNKYAKKQSSLCDPLAGWRLRMILRNRPEAFLCQPDSQLLDDAAKLWIPQPVPEIKEKKMPVQPLQNSQTDQEKNFWHFAVYNLKKVLRRSLGYSDRSKIHD